MIGHFFLFFFHYIKRYVYELYVLHFENGDHTEAGFTLKLYADQLSWNEDLFTLGIVAKPEWELKAKHYKQVYHFPFRDVETNKINKFDR